MRIAIISDIHGNKNALDSVLADISHQNVDQVICAGDFIDPLPESRIVWQQLKESKTQMIRGNHEDYIISVHTDPTSPQTTDESWKPVRTTAKVFSTADTDELKKLPLKIYLEEVNALICHASPSSNKKGWRDGINSELETELSCEKADIIICGHWHLIREQNLGRKKLVMVGSVGVPLHGKQEAEYATIQKSTDGWKVENHFVPYDYLGTVQKYVESGFVHDAAPISWLLLDELITANRRIAPFIAWRNANADQQAKPWITAVENYFYEIGRWDEIKKVARI